MSCASSSVSAERPATSGLSAMRKADRALWQINHGVPTRVPISPTMQSLKLSSKSEESTPRGGRKSFLRFLNAATLTFLRYQPQPTSSSERGLSFLEKED